MRRGKVLVVGAAEAGKSTLIRALVPQAMNLEVRGRTVAMDHATLSRDGVHLSLVGVPGQARFAGVREALAGGSVAALWVHRGGHDVDSATAELIASFAARGIPYLVVVNEHAGSAGADGWAVPPACPAPRAVIRGDLKTSRETAERIATAVADLVRGALAGRKGV